MKYIEGQFYNIFSVSLRRKDYEINPAIYYRNYCTNFYASDVANDFQRY